MFNDNTDKDLLRSLYIDRQKEYPKDKCCVLMLECRDMSSKKEEDKTFIRIHGTGENIISGLFALTQRTAEVIGISAPTLLSYLAKGLAALEVQRLETLSPEDLAKELIRLLSLEA